MAAHTSRRSLLARAAALTAVPAIGSVVAETALAAPARAAGSSDLPDYAPVPQSSLGPALNSQGYYVGRIKRNLYWVTDGTYVSAFLATRDGVVLLDAPPSIGHNIQRAIDDVTKPNGLSNKVTHLIYSHHHSDHAGGSGIFGRHVTRIGHSETRRLLLRDNDPNKPAPEETFEDHRVLHIGGERIGTRLAGRQPHPRQHLHPPPQPRHADAGGRGPARLGAVRQPQHQRGHPGLPAGTGQGPQVPVDHLHRRPPRPTGHTPRPQDPHRLHGRPGDGDPHRPHHGRRHPLLREVRQQHLGRGQDLPRRGDRRRRPPSSTEVHRRPRRRRRLHREQRLHAHGVDAPRQRLRNDRPRLTRPDPHQERDCDESDSAVRLRWTRGAHRDRDPRTRAARAGRVRVQGRAPP
ncbi:hypothetical protein ACRAWF_10190 [Streptomyces sp. L7]